MMKITDARQKIIMRKMQRTTQKLTDAREILKQKRKEAAKKSAGNKSIAPSFRSNTFKRQSPPGLRSFKHFPKRMSDSLKSDSEKKVSLKDGMITVTARQNVGNSLATPKRPTDKQIMATDAGITIVKVNTSSPLQRSPVMDTRICKEAMDIDWEESPPLEYRRHLNAASLDKPAYPKVDLRSSISKQYLLGKFPDREGSWQQVPVPSPLVPQSYSVLVTNLHPSVTEDDILELFSDIGAIRSTRFLHPGTAVICYLRKTDAEKACLAYHNRLLDGLPMQCTIIPETSAGKPSHGSESIRLTSLERTAASTDLGSPLQSRNQFSIGNPQKPVKFTVRLP